jgi:hydrogenase maturation protein HypF
MEPQIEGTLRRTRFTVQGIVQGVGFRPFVYGLALRLGLVGFVLNDSSGVVIEVEGAPPALQAFEEALRKEAPPLARIDAVLVELMSVRHETAFTIVQSLDSAGGSTIIPPDAATCDDCRREVFDPTNRRYGYPFTNCTNCGPRFTIIEDVPYDRDKTTMRAFPMCRECQAEYDNPLDRRFFAQPNTCPTCGPQLVLLDANGIPIETPDAIVTAAQQLADGMLLAIKGLGGFYLAGDALNATTVARLRHFKQPADNLLTLMVPDLATARKLCDMNEAEADLLASRQRPVALLRRRSDVRVLDEVTIGMLLPYTPLHHLLLSAYAAMIEVHRLPILAITESATGDHPIIFQDEDAYKRLQPLVDGILTSNRAIAIGCEDSVARAIAGGEQTIQRSRGYAPLPLALPKESPVPLLACGTRRRNTFCLTIGSQSFMSSPLGNLERPEFLAAYRHRLDHFQRLFGSPQAIVHDLDPADQTTQYALGESVAQKLGVQHHHAHIASVLAEHAIPGPAIGIVADTSGYGTDGSLWGCEVLITDLGKFERVAHLAYAPLQTAAPQASGAMTSSLGNLFDIVAALTGVQQTTLYEGQAILTFEGMAEEISELSYPVSLGTATSDGAPAVMETYALTQAISADVRRGLSAPMIIGGFFSAVIEMLVAACHRAQMLSGLNEVALSGEVLRNRVFLEQLIARLETKNFQVYINRQAPFDDSGLSYGQAAIATTNLQQR